MNNISKIILAGFAAFWASCSNEKDTPDVTGATTEPNTSPMAALTEEEVVLLNKSFWTLVDSEKVKYIENSTPDGGNVDIYQPIIEIDSNTIAQQKLMHPFFGIIPDTVYKYPSLDARRTCNVSAFPELFGVEFAQALDTGNVYYSEIEKRKHYSSTMATRIVEVDGEPVIMKTVAQTNYWGYGVSCSEFLEQFKNSCTESNGIFRDFGDGCRNKMLNMACSMLMPEGKSRDEVVQAFTSAYKNECIEDSTRYAAVDDKDNAQKGCSSGMSVGENGEVSYYGDCPLPEDNFNAELDSLDKIWRTNLSRTFDAYQKQFAVYEEVIDGMTYLHHYPELVFGDGSAYNTFPDAEVAGAYKKEGVYHLPDSLVSVFFPEAANSPYVFDALRRHDQTYYIVVLKDIGAKGHVLNKIDASGVHVRDILKSGENCPEDSTEHYSVYLVRGSAEWDVSDKPILRDTYTSPLWNCNDPESLERIEPYGEWTSRDGFV